MEKHMETLSKTKEEIIKEALNKANQSALVTDKENKDKDHATTPLTSHIPESHHPKKLHEHFKNLLQSHKILEHSLTKTFTRLFKLIDKEHHETLTSLKEEVLNNLGEHHHKLLKPLEHTSETSHNDAKNVRS